MSNEVILPFLVECFLQTTIVALILGAAAIVFRNRPHVAYVFLAIIVMKCLCPPVIQSPWAIFRVAAVTGTTAPAPPAITSVSLPPTVRLPGTDAASGSATISHTDTTAIASSWQFPWREFLAAVWAIGFIFLALRSWRGLRVAKRNWLKSAQPTPDHVLDMVEAMRTKLRIRRPVQVIVNSAQYGPLVSGGWHPVVVLPSALVESADRRELQSSITHELVHVRRGDTTLCFFQSLATALWWFHPLIWWASRELDRVCERCCDQETIASLGCRPRHYVFSLLRVAELRQHIRHVPGLSGSRPLHITANRLRELMGRSRFAARPPIYCQIALVVLATTLLPITTHSQQEAKLYSSAANDDTLHSHAWNIDRAFFEEDWKTAADQYQVYLEANPYDALRRFRLGYAFHFMQRYDCARDAYEAVVDLPEMRPQALYNLACIHCVQGRPDQAKEVLNQSRAAGMVLARPVVEDPDFANLLGDADFLKIAESFPVIDRQEVLSQLDDWIGEWELLNDDSQVLGVSTVTKEDGGFMITEKWQPRGRVGGTSVTYYDASVQKWKQTFVSGKGPVTCYEGTFSDGVLELIGNTVFPNGAKTISRAQMTFTSQDEVQFLMESSRDEGQSWITKFRGTYRRVS